jgi:hypothetical protein
VLSTIRRDDAPHSRVFAADIKKQISCIDLKSGDVRPFVAIAYANAICLADGLLYAAHEGALSIVHFDSGAVQHSAVKTLHGRSWDHARGIAVLPILCAFLIGVACTPFPESPFASVPVLSVSELTRSAVHCATMRALTGLSLCPVTN